MTDMDWHELPAAPDGEADRPTRYLFVVSRTRLDLLLTARTRFMDDRTVHVMLDRREHERRSRARPMAFPDRRRRPDRRRSADYWEDLAHHPAVIIPLHRRRPTSPEIGRVPSTRERDKEPTMETVLIDEERLAAWIEESRHVVQRLFPALLEEQDTLKRELQRATRRERELEEDNHALRAEVGRVTAAHTDLIERLGQLLAQMGQVLEPARALPRPAPPAGDAASAAPLGRVLVVDDEQLVAATLRDALVHAGYAVKVAVSGREALGLVPVFEPDVVLLDSTMPEMSGGEVLDHLRRDHADVPVIMVTGNHDDSVARGALARGAFDYIAKPFTLELVERVVARAVSLHRR
jgi:CheY-like chemotaxis protein